MGVLEDAEFATAEASAAALDRAVSEDDSDGHHENDQSEDARGDEKESHGTSG